MKQPLLAREGWWHIAIAFTVALVGTWLWGSWSWPLWLVLLFVLQFFRDPQRHIPQQPRAVIAPADGKVIEISESKDPYLQRDARKISIFMNVFSVHSNRIPVAGQVRDIWYSPGKFVNAALDKASTDNERNAVWIRTDDGQDVVSVQVAGLIARRILCYLQKGDHVTTGQRYGFIRFGSRVDLFLPLDATLNIQLGEWVSAGSDIIGRLNHEEAAEDAE